MASGGGEDGDFGFQIAPMVDVVFVLMLFFMAISGQVVTEKELRMDLPSRPPEAQVQAPLRPIMVDITSDGFVFINNIQMGTGNKDKELVQLRERLTSMVGDQANPDPVVIRPALDTMQERVVDVLNACAAAKVKNLSFS